MRRITSFLIVLALISSVAAGCGGPSSNQEPEGPLYYMVVSKNIRTLPGPNPMVEVYAYVVEFTAPGGGVQTKTVAAYEDKYFDMFPPPDCYWKAVVGKVLPEECR